MIRINLLPARPRRSLIPEPAVFGALAAVFVALALTYLYGVWRTNELNGEITTITAETAALHPRVEDVLQLEANIEDLQARESLLQGLEDHATPWADLLTDLAQRTPADVWLANVSSVGSNSTFTVQGTAHSYHSVAAFMRQLKVSPFYGRVTLGTAQDIDDQSEQTEAVQFGLSLSMRPQSDVAKQELEGVAP